MPELTESDKAIFRAAISLNDTAQRDAFLVQACGENATLLEQLRKLLAADDVADQFLRLPANLLLIDESQARRSCVQETDVDDEELRQNVESVLAPHQEAANHLNNGPAAGAREQEEPGSTIGCYKLLERIGDGGFGVVYMAEQLEPFRRRVALKIIKLGMDTKQVIGRFEAEQQALAIMDHPNIAKVFDAGSTETGRPYFVMELVKGTPITEFCDSEELVTRERLELFSRVCDAVQHAHQKGIIHRDIKPSNVLVALNDGCPVPKVIDFGIAKATENRLTERSVFTEMRQLIGTPAYMSPEQATFNNFDIDTRSDVYSLGALLYELLTGTAPFDDRQLRSLAYDELCRVIREDVPQTPSQRVSSVKRASKGHVASGQRSLVSERTAACLQGEIDWIVMKALEKDRARRYESPNSLSDDIKRFLRGEPVSAVRPSNAYRLKKLVVRHRTLAVSITAVILALILGAAAAVVGFVRAEIARANLEDQLVENRELLYKSDMATAMQAWHDGRMDVVGQLLRRHGGQSTGEDLRGFEWYFLWDQVQKTNNVSTFPHKNGPLDFVFSQDGSKIVCADGADLRVWDTLSGVATTLPGQDRILAIGRAENGNLVASGGVDGTIRLWDLEKLTHRVLGHDSFPNGHELLDVQFSPNGATLVAIFDSVNSIYFWDLAADKALAPLACPDSRGPNLIRLSHDGQYLVAALGEEFEPVLWELDTRSVLPLAGISGGASALAISPDDVLSVGSIDGTISLWDLKNRRPIGNPMRHAMRVTSLAFSPDGRYLASGNSGNVVQFWDISTHEVMGSLAGITDGARSIRFSTDGEKIATLGGDGTVRVWDIDQVGQGVFDRFEKAVTGVFVLEKGNSVVTLDMQGSIHINNLGSREPLYEQSLLGDKTEEEDREELYPAAVSADGNLLAAGTNRGDLIFFDLRKRLVLKQFQAHDEKIWWPAISPDGRRCVTASGDGSVRLWEVPSGKPLKKLIQIAIPFEGAAFAPDGIHVAAANFAGSIYVWNVDGGQQFVSEPPAYHGRLYRVIFAPDGKTLAACGEDSRILLWDLSDGVVAGLQRDPVYLSGHAGRVLDLSFSADSRLLASAGVGSVLLWDMSEKKLRARFYDHRSEVTCVAFSPQGNLLISGDFGGKVILRKAATNAEVSAAMR